jgi:ATP/maltotriose-dependent transcriptional regulator MalT
VTEHSGLAEETTDREAQSREAQSREAHARQYFLARDLHDRSIQTISDVGASLQSLARHTRDPGLRHRLIDEMCALDTAVLAIQSAYSTLIDPLAVTGPAGPRGTRGSMTQPQSHQPQSHQPQQDTPGSAIHTLTQRERAVLTLITQGRTNRQIGVELALAEKTVKNYVSAILAKLGMQRRTQAAVFGALLTESA